MKKTIFAVLFTLLALSGTAFAADGDIIKMKMDGTVKNTGGSITFTLADPTTNEFILLAVELQIFERQEGNTQWTAYTDQSGAESKRKLIQNPSSLKFEVSFENLEEYREKAKYKIGYRYYMQSTDDPSKIVIAGESVKSGWRLVGEPDGTIATDAGLMFYRNSAPTVSVTEISFDVQTISGTQKLYCTPGQLADVWMPSDSLLNGVTVSYNAEDFDIEDTLSISYRLVNVADNSVIREGALDSNGKIISDADANHVRLILTATDAWGASSETDALNLKLDKEAPQVTAQFNDMGRVLKGRNLYSKFTITDGQNEALSNGNVYYTIRRNGMVIYQNVKFSNNSDGQYTVNLTGMADGHYEMELTIFDKAHNKTIHVLTQTLDNTAPSVTFLTPEQNVAATLYSTWMNESRKILFTAADSGAGVKSCSYYLDNSWNGSISLGSSKGEYSFSVNVSSTKTGKLYYYFYIYDNACTVNQTTNAANTTVSGNYTFVTRYVWLDKTPPSITIHAEETEWYSAPLTIYADFYDYPSTASVTDNSGVQSKYYTVTQTAEPDGNWQTYTAGVTFDTGGVFYLHCKAVDYAGNQTVVSKEIKMNSPVRMIGDVTPTDEYRHTIYNKTGGLYIIKNTAYTTKYHFNAEDLDINDTLRTDVALVSQDNEAVYSIVSADNASNGTAQRDVVFSLPYTTSDGTPLPDGIYTLYVSVTEIKNDGTEIPTIQNISSGEIMLKRNSPPEPAINVADGKVSIDYPEEPLADSLNRSDIKALYKRQYKAVYETGAAEGAYEAYISPIDTADMTVTALYTDPAGNIATASKRIFKDEDDSAVTDILKDGNTVNVDESRPANVYYIGTRREKQKGIDQSIFNFLY